MLFLLKNRTHSEIHSRDHTTAYSQDFVITGIVMERRGGGRIMHELSVSVPLDFRPLYCTLHLRTRFYRSSLRESYNQKTPVFRVAFWSYMASIRARTYLHALLFFPTAIPSWQGKNLAKRKGGYVIRRAHLFPSRSPLHLCTWCLISISHGVCGGKR